MPFLDVYEHAFDEDVPLPRQTRVEDGDSEEQTPSQDGPSAGINDEEGRSLP